MARKKVERQRVERQKIERKKQPSRKANKGFHEFFSPDPDVDPFAEVDYESGDLESTAQEEIHVLDEATAEAIRAEKRAFVEKIDTEYWFVACFQNREQKEHFLREIGILHQGDKYINGLFMAEVLGVKIEPIEIKPMKNRPKRPALLKGHPSIK